MNKIATTELLRRRNRLGTPQGTYVWGNNDNYQLGVNDPYYVSTIVEPNIPSIFTQVACGNGFFLALSETGDIYTWGNNTTGQLGHGDTIPRSQPEKIVIDVTFKYIACGYTHAAAISTDGNLYLWGSNTYGQLSQNNTTVKNIPTLVGSYYTWTSVACGEDFTIAINTNKEVFTCGYNFYGQLGTGNTTAVSYLNKIGVATNWEFVSCGRYHTLLINSAGELWCCGNSAYGQLGIGTISTIKSLTKSSIGVPVTKAAGGHYHTVVIGQDGKAYGVGYNSQYQLGPLLPSMTTTEFTAIDANTDWADVACNINATTIINTSNQIYTCGNNDNGELGTGNTLLLREFTQSWFLYSNWNKIACGPYDTAVINTSKKVWANGLFYKEQSGNTGSNIPRKIEDINFTSIHAGHRASFNITAGAKLTQWGRNVYKLGISLNNDYIPSWLYGNTNNIIYPHYKRDYVYAYNGNIILLNKLLDCRNTIGYCVYLDCNYKHVKTYPDIYCINSYGELFIIKNITSSSTFTIQKVESSQLWKFVACCNGSIFAISVGGELYSWGNNANGQLGLGDLVDRTSPTKITHPFTWDKVVCGGYCWYLSSAIAVYAIDSNGELYQWGRDFLGSNYTSPVKVGTKSNWVDISCSLSTMTYNEETLSSDGYHIAAIDSNGALYTAGNNERGQLGLGTTESKVDLTRVGDSSNWTQVVCLTWLDCSSTHSFDGGRTIALNSDGEIYVCGDKLTSWTISSNSRGPAYYNTSFIKLSGAYTNCLLYGGTDKAEVYSVLITDNYAGQALPSGYNFYYGPQVGSQPNTIYVTSSVNDSFIIKYPGELWGCGFNDYGQLGIGTSTSISSFIKIGQAAYWTKVACGARHMVALNILKEMWGAGTSVNALDGTTSNTLRKINIPFGCLDIACCIDATIVLSEDGELYAGGANGYGQLGIGTTVTTTIDKIGLNTDWARIRCGDYHAAAINSNGELYVWGRNDKGQLGVGDNTNKLSPVRVDYYGTSDPILVKDVSCGSDFTILITTEGRMYATGNGNYGQLGAGEVASINYFIPVNEDTNWKSVSAGYDHVMATKTIRLE